MSLTAVTSFLLLPPNWSTTVTCKFSFCLSLSFQYSIHITSHADLWASAHQSTLHFLHIPQTASGFGSGRSSCLSTINISWALSICQALCEAYSSEQERNVSWPHGIYILAGEKGKSVKGIPCKDNIHKHSAERRSQVCSKNWQVNVAGV